jgi:polyhydroxyalkanoate synthase subunit PhaC
MPMPQPRRTPSPRPGPRPLPLHLTAAAMTWLSSAAALPLLRSMSAGSPTGPMPEPADASAADPAWMPLVRLPWQKAVRGRADALRRELADVDPEAFTAAVGREVRRRLDEFATGLTTYRRHAYRRTLDDAPSVWHEGTTHLRDYSGLSDSGAEPDGQGAPLLVVPSLINRAYVLDLEAERSLMRFLAARGFRPFLVDWGRPGAVERRFGLAEYVLGRLGQALDRVRELSGRKPALIGYCMGGNLALGLAAARSRDVAALALLATPWDFHADRPDLAHAFANMMTPWMSAVEQFGELPVDVLQALFFSLDPFLGARKFRSFAKLDPTSAKAVEFVALEDWLNDGVPLVAGVARECLLGWYGANEPARGEWRLGGLAVRPERITLPSLTVIPEQDRIVPPASAQALARALPNVTKLAPPLGHIGMMVSGQAQSAVWEPLARWLDSFQYESL